ncbi:MAG: SDR family oxidoreductase [Prolixibacteraceae bacterium]|nr:SDR family oxidoreductase [Prolixibacteraceae bacterium]
MKDFTNKTTLITGGASGIGKIMVRLLLEQNSRVIIWDINQEKIDETIKEFLGKGAISGYRIDVSDTTMVKEMAQKVKDENGKVDILINNAGIVVGKYFHEHKTDDIIKTFDVNTLAPMIVTGEFLGDMMKQDSGHICNIASSAGIVSNPKMSVYAASKWAVIGWSDSLRIEMQKLKKKVRVTTIMPYYINTGMFNGVKSKIPILEAENAARAIVKAIKKNKKMITLPRYIYNITRLSQGLLTIGMFDWFTGKVFGIYNTMEHFTGHIKEFYK